MSDPTQACELANRRGERHTGPIGRKVERGAGLRRRPHMKSASVRLPGHGDPVAGDPVAGCEVEQPNVGVRRDSSSEKCRDSCRVVTTGMVEGRMESGGYHERAGRFRLQVENPGVVGIDRTSVE